MKLRNNKGFAGIDISISVILILIFIPTVFGSIYNIQRNSAWTKRESRAVNIASNVLETAKNVPYNEVTLGAGSGFVGALNQVYTAVDLANGEFSYVGQDEEMYKIEIDISNYYPENIKVADRRDYIKEINVVVTYSVGKKLKTVTIGTDIQK